MTARRFIAMYCLVCVFLVRPAAAHVVATGLAVVTLDGPEVDYQLTVIPAELAEPAAQTLLDAAAGDRQAAERSAEFIRAAVTVRVGGSPCRPGRIAIQGTGSGDGKTLLRYALHCPAPPGHFELEEDWRGLFGPHYQTIVSLRARQASGEYALGDGNRRFSVDYGMPAPSGVLGFVRLGVAHILTGYDHLLFLLALLIGAPRLWRVLGIVTAFTLARSVTLSLAVLGLVHVPGAIVEPAIAASIVWVVAENLFGQSSRR